MSKPTCFLLVSDSPDDYGNQVLQEALGTLGSVQVVPERDLGSLLQQQTYTVVVVDAGAVKNAPQVVAQVRSLAPNAQVVIVTASPHWKIARAAFLAGARDYVYKSQNEAEILACFQAIVG
jgi:DNA-binding NarL/FixJ family response regulator